MPADPAVSPVAQLGLTVLRNGNARVVEEATARLILEVDVTYPRWFGPLPRMLGLKRRKSVLLTGMAMLVWQRIDDRTTLGAHIDWLAADQQLSFNEARLIMLQFLRSLSLKGLVVLGDRTLVSSGACAPTA